LKEAEAGAVVTELCRKHAMSSATYYAWKAKFGGLEVSDAKRLRALEEENGRLKRLLADTMLDNAGLKDLLSKNGSARRKAGGGRASPDDAGDERAAGVHGRRRGSDEHSISFVPG
jgi:putative transposase